MIRSILTGIAATAALLSPVPAGAQALTPMEGSVASFGEEFAVRVQSMNPYEHRIGIEMRVYDHKFRPVPSARVVPDSFYLGGGATRPVIAYVPFEGQSPRYVRVCAESVPYRQSTTPIRTRVCGKFQALRR